MGAAVVVRPDEVSLGVLVSAVPRDAVDAAVSLRGAGEALGRQAAGACDGVLDDGVVPVRPGRVLGRADCQRDHQVRKRLGRTVMREVFERTCGPVAGDASPVAGLLALGTARGSWLCGWRLLAIDRFEVDVPDTPPMQPNSGTPGRVPTGWPTPRRGWWRWPSAVVSGRGCRGGRRPRPARP